MKIFVRLILIFLLCFFSIGINPGQAEYNVSLVNRDGFSSARESIYLKLLPPKDTTIISNNNGGQELNAARSGNGNGNFSSANGVAHNNFYTQQFKIYSNKIINSKSHNISSYLKNEICVRAP